MRIFNIEGTTIQLNGHEVKGLSEDADALTMPDSFELATVRRGATGDMAVFSTGDRGGQVAIKLLPHSESLPFFMQQMAVLRGGGVVVWDGEITNTQAQWSFRLRRGVLVSGPLGQTMGKSDVANQTFTWEFEDIIPSYEKVQSQSDQPGPII